MNLNKISLCACMLSNLLNLRVISCMQTITENPTLPLPRQCLDYGGRVRCDCGRRRHCRMCRCLGNDVIWLQMSPAGEKRKSSIRG